MGFLDSLPTMAEVNARPCAKSKAEMVTSRDENKIARRLDERQLEKWRKAVTKRDGMTCRWCRRECVPTLENVPEQAQTHHATPREHRPTRYDVRNGIRLCGSCHDRITGTVGEKAIIVALATFVLDGREYPDMSQAVNFKRIA